ncbi:MAG: hypothetical protein JNL28_06785 [Planctomycetes bacterium]|nr:hypothetical protein [Planctomycetota bacterium]
MAARRTAGASRRETKMTSRRGDAAEASGEAPGGMTMVDGVAIVTTLLLIGALLLVDYHLGRHFGVGVFFAK